jgi:hypothetical protein
MGLTEYTCGHCGGKFTKTEEQEAFAQKEKKELWSEREIAAGVVEICEDCFQQFMKWFKEHPEIRIQ